MSFLDQFYLLQDLLGLIKGRRFTLTMRGVIPCNLQRTVEDTRHAPLNSRNELSYFLFQRTMGWNANCVHCNISALMVFLTCYIQVYDLYD